MQTTEFKNNVKTAGEYLERAGVNVSHTQLLEAISRAFGERNWSTMRTLLANPPAKSVPAQEAEPLPVEVPNWTPSQGSMPDEAFNRRGGDCCPACGGKEIDADGIEVDGSEAWEENTCLNPLCEATWRTNYDISGYTSLEVGAGWKQRGTVVRKDVVEALVEHVKSMAGKYDFSVDDQATASRLARESDEHLGLDASAAEIRKAAQDLTE